MEQKFTTQTANTEETTVPSALYATTVESEQEEDSTTTTTVESYQEENLTFIDSDDDGDAEYRVYGGYENYLEREDITSVYMWVAVSGVEVLEANRPASYVPGMYGREEPVHIKWYGPDLMNEVTAQLPQYDFVFLNLYRDDTGDYLGPVSYTNSSEVAEAYKDHLYEYAEEFVQAVMEDASPAEIEQAEREFKNATVPLYYYDEDEKILAYEDSPNIPPWIYSDREAESLGEPPGVTGKIQNTVKEHYEAIELGDLEAAYSYFSSTYQKTMDREAWIEEQESEEINIHSVGESDAEVISENSAWARIKVEVLLDDELYPAEVTWKLIREGREWKLNEQLALEIDELPLRRE